MMMTISPSESILLGESVPGAAHLRQHRENQDAVKVRSYGYGCVSAVADGVGSQKYAGYGSRAAVQAVHEVFCAYARGDVDRGRITQTISSRYADMVKPAFRGQAATTCLFAAHIYAEGLFLGQVGDGICCGFLNGIPFSLAEKQDAFSNLVVPLSAVGGKAARWQTQFLPMERLREIELMLATDGVSEDLLPGQEAAFARYLLTRVAARKAAERREGLRQVLERWETPLAQDDRTISLYRYMQAKTGGL